MTDGGIRRWESMTTGEATEAAAADPVVVLPLAAIEQHGPHLPLSTDLDIGVGILSRAFAELPVEFPAWSLPPRAIGTSEEHDRFPGSLSTDPSSLVNFIQEVGASLAGTGIRRLVLSNSHGGNRYAMETAGLWLRRTHGMLVVKASYFRFDRPEGLALPESEWRHGLHGGAVETAMMLHLSPDRVRAEAIRDFPSFGSELEESLRRLGPEGQASFSWLSGDLNAAGVVGDARLASAEMGERLVDHYGRALADVILDAREFPLDRLR